MRFLMHILLPAAALLALTANLLIPDPDHRDLDDARALAERMRTFARVTEARYRAVDELLEGRQSLAATAARFQALAAEDPYDAVANLKLTFPEYAGADVHYLHVILYAEAQLRYLGRDLSFAKPLRSELECLRNSKASSTAPDMERSLRPAIE